MRTNLVAVAAIAAATLSFSHQPAKAYATAPWCAVINLGTGSVYWDCSYSSIETCRPNVLAGNRGWCNPNPYYAYQPPERRRNRKR
jgi:hypothetical protein